MILAIARLAAIGFVLATILYVVLSLYSRSLHREHLERTWDEQGLSGDRDAWIEDGMKDYAHSLRKRLILLVYVVPVVLASVILYLVNYH